eukprot:Sspe_Gene.86774::Locus_57540_Transcript_1_1_Confidence_1.000_Length_792::g.86774::m.86774
MEASGVEWAGRQGADTQFQFGCMPVTMTHRYRSIQKLHRLLETYGEVLLERDEERKAQEAAGSAELAKAEAQIEELTAKSKMLLEKARKVQDVLECPGPLRTDHAEEILNEVVEEETDTEPPPPVQPAAPGKKGKAATKRTAGGDAKQDPFSLPPDDDEEEAVIAHPRKRRKSRGR